MVGDGNLSKAQAHPIQHQKTNKMQISTYEATLIGHQMLDWRAKIQATIPPPNHDFDSQIQVLFIQKLDKVLKQITTVDALIHILPLQKNPDDIPLVSYSKLAQPPKQHTSKFYDNFMYLAT